MSRYKRLLNLSPWLIAASLLAACTQAPQWTLFFTPIQGAGPEAQVSKLVVADIQGYYQTLAQCQHKAEGLMKLALIQANAPRGVYQCADECLVEADNSLNCQQVIQTGSHNEV
ncbi:hypothetical protein [Shewanella sp.]|uniref:hypothetical protein n=1 Tax=Shewanella sp. TaxID=50422 RepID=UPI004053B197